MRYEKIEEALHTITGVHLGAESDHFAEALLRAQIVQLPFSSAPDIESVDSFLSSWLLGLTFKSASSQSVTVYSAVIPDAPASSVLVELHAHRDGHTTAFATLLRKDSIHIPYLQSRGICI